VVESDAKLALVCLTVVERLDFSRRGDGNKLV